MSIYEDAKKVISHWDWFVRRVGYHVPSHDVTDVTTAREVVRLTEAMRRVAAVENPRSDEHHAEFGVEYPGGAAVAERMREIALESITNEGTDT